MAGRKSPIEHVIVLMLENRSFDHMFGFSSHSCLAQNCLELADAENHTSQCGTVKPYCDNNYELHRDLDHSHVGVLEQLFGEAKYYGELEGKKPDCSGFLQNHAQHLGSCHHAHEAMKCMKEGQLPVLATLAKEFAVCARWFSSVPGETWPNRNFLHAGTSDGEVNIAKRFYMDPTIFEDLDDHGKSWGIYHDGPPQAWAFANLFSPGTPMTKKLRDLRLSWLLPERLKPPYLSPKNFHDAGQQERNDPSQLTRDIQNDRLPTYAFVEPNHGLGLRGNPRKSTISNSQHPQSNTYSNGADFKRGENLICDIYEALRNKPEVFNKTVFIITYDEHGGFYDHVPPPRSVAPPEKPWSVERVWLTLRMPSKKERLERDKAKFDFKLLGVRVPAVVVSPWVAKGDVDHTIYDHTSIIKTLRDLFLPGTRPLTDRERDANSLLGLLTAAQPRGIETLPALTHHGDLEDGEETPSPQEAPNTNFDDLDGFSQSLILLTYAIDSVLDGAKKQELIDFRGYDFKKYGIDRYDSLGNDLARITNIAHICSRFAEHTEVRRGDGPRLSAGDMFEDIRRLFETAKQALTKRFPSDGPGAGRPT